MTLVEVVSMSASENNERPLVVITYDLFGRLLALLFRLFFIYAGALIIVADIFLFMDVLGWLIFVTMMFRFMDILLFDKALITDKSFIKKWYFLGSVKLDIKNLKCKKASTKLGGTLLFDEQGQKGKNLLLGLDMLPLNKALLKDIKMALVGLDVISEDDCAWID